MNDRTCPKCGADAKEKHMEWTRFECGTANVGRRIVEDGYDCYENQLAAVTKERDDKTEFIRVMIEKAASKHRPAYDELAMKTMKVDDENTRLRGLLGEIEGAFNTAEDDPSEAWFKIGEALARINEGSE
jgi:hypothetical protein